jgi:hypothetical protein
MTSFTTTKLRFYYDKIRISLLNKMALFMKKDAFLISEKRPIAEERY